MSVAQLAQADFLYSETKALHRDSQRCISGPRKVQCPEPGCHLYPHTVQKSSVLCRTSCVNALQSRLNWLASAQLSMAAQPTLHGHWACSLGWFLAAPGDIDCACAGQAIYFIS